MERWAPLRSERSLTFSAAAILLHLSVFPLSMWFIFSSILAGGAGTTTMLP